MLGTKRSDLRSVFRIVADSTGLARFPTLVQPNLAALKGWAVQMQGHSRLVAGWIPDFMVPQTVFDKDQASFLVGLVLRTDQLVFAVVLVTTFLHLSLQDPHPASVAGMIVDWAESTRIPTQQEQRIRYMIRGDQVARVGSVAVKVRKAVPFFVAMII